MVHSVTSDGLNGAPSSSARDLLTIVVPLAGRGSRFSEAGFADPKPLINVCGQPMIKLVIDNIRPSQAHRFVFVCQRQHLVSYGLAAALEGWAPGCVVVALDGVTEGAACTVLAAREHIGPGPLMIANSDQYVDIDINIYLAAFVPGSDGLIMTMYADDPKWSYAETDTSGAVTRVVEKQVISQDATVGIYNFASGDLFLQAADAMIANNRRVNGEFYVAPVYEELISAGRRVTAYNIGEVSESMFGLGTPADLATFLNLWGDRIPAGTKC